MSKAALVTGADGFVGRRLCTRLRAAGWTVHQADRQGRDDTHACDVTDRAALEVLLEALPDLTHVFHLAAMTFVPAASAHPVQAMLVNYGGSLNLAQALLARGRPVRLVFIGSADAYGPPEYLPIDEAHPLRPVNPYAISKAAADQALDWLHRAHGLDVVRMRPFNHAGPTQEGDFVLASFARQVAAIATGAAEEPVVRTGNLDAARDFSHVDDVIEAYLLAAEHGAAGMVYNVCSGAAQRVGDALDRLIEFSGCAIRVERDPARYRPVDVPEVRGSHARLSEATGWEPQRSFDTLLKELFDAWRARLEAGQA